MVKDMESAQKSNTCDFLTYGKKLTSQSNKCACKQQRGVCLQLSHQGRLECWYHTAGKERTNLWPLFLAVYSQAFLVSIIKRWIHFRPVILVLRSCPNGQRHTCRTFTAFCVYPQSPGKKSRCPHSAAKNGTKPLWGQVWHKWADWSTTKASAYPLSSYATRIISMCMPG